MKNIRALPGDVAVADVTQTSPSRTGKTPSKKKTDSTLDIRDPDAYQDSVMDIWAWVEKNSQLVVLLAAVLIVAGVIYSIVGWWGRHQERKAQEAYYSVEEKYSKTKEGYDRAKLKLAMPALAAKDKKDEKVDQPATGDLTKDYGNTVPDLAKIARDYPSTSAGAQAAIMAGDAYMTYHKYDEAAEIAQVPVKGLSDKNLLSNLARMMWGSAVATKGDCKQAIEIWKPLLDNKAMAFVQSDASLRSGLCYESLNQPTDAMKMYEKVAADASAGQGGESPTAATAKGLLRALQLKTKAPAAAPAAPQKG